MASISPRPTMTFFHSKVQPPLLNGNNINNLKNINNLINLNNVLFLTGLTSAQTNVILQKHWQQQQCSQ
ncbi:hypothetical protein DITRI_Ditri02bG0148600 [Diplodiscus trichospermus]